MMPLHPVLGVDHNPRLGVNVLDCEPQVFLWNPARAPKMALAVAHSGRLPLMVRLPPMLGVDYNPRLGVHVLVRLPPMLGVDYNPRPGASVLDCDPARALKV